MAARNGRAVENSMGNLLRAGVLLAAAVVLFGGVLFLIQNAHGVVDYRDFRGELSAYRSLHGIIPAALALDPLGVIQFGLLLLIATPVARVFFALLVFLRDRDRIFVAITLTVLAVLLYGFLGGKV